MITKAIAVVVAIAAAAASLGLAANSVIGAYTGRAALATQVAQLEAKITEKNAAIEFAESERDQARRDAKTEIDKLKADIKDRERIAAAAADRIKTIQQERDHARNELRRHASENPEFDRCMYVRLPLGLLPAPTSGPTRFVDRDFFVAPIGALDGAPGAGDPETIGDALALAPEFQASFRECESDKAAMRDWVASKTVPVPTTGVPPS